MQFLSVIVVLGIIGTVVAVSNSNYDPRGLEQKLRKSVATSKSIKPAGTTPIYRSVGGQIQAISVTNQEEPTLFVTIEGKNVAGVVSKKEYEEIAIGDTVRVSYLQPKFWGDPIVVMIK